MNEIIAIVFSIVICIICIVFAYGSQQAQSRVDKLNKDAQDKFRLDNEEWKRNGMKTLPPTPPLRYDWK